MANFAQQFALNELEIELPSGTRVKTTRPDALTILSESDDIPDTFYNALLSATRGGGNPAADIQSGQEMAQFLKALNTLVVQVAIRHWTSPIVITDRDPDLDQNEIGIVHVKAMAMGDKQFLVNWAMNGGDPVDLLQRFRSQAGADVSGSPDGA